MATEPDKRARAQRASSQRRTILWATVALLIALSIPIHIPRNASQTDNNLDINHSHSAESTATTPPIVHILKFLFGLRHLIKTPLFLAYGILSALFTTLFTYLLYLLQPFILAAQILLFIFIIAPYRMIAYMLQILYPVYVLGGAACIIGAFFGLCASSLHSMLIYIIFGPKKAENPLTENPR